MNSDLVGTLRKTLVDVQQNSEFAENEVAIIDLRRNLAKAIGELEILKVTQRARNTSRLVRQGAEA